MKTIGTLGRILVPFSLVLLAACQNMPSKNNANQATNTPGQQTAAQAQQAQQAQRQGAPVAVYLADTTEQAGWATVSTQSGALYVKPQPVITGDDMASFQTGSSKQGDGVLVFELSDTGNAKIRQTTTENPGQRLALVVGQSLITAPSYSAPLTSKSLVFVVGTQENARAIAQAIVGQPATDAQGGTPATQNGAGNAQ